MGNKSSESYLDNLLDSISDGASKKKKENIEQPKQEEADALSFLDEKSKITAEDDDFMRAFEAELESDAYKDYFAGFESDLEADQSHNLEIHEKSGIPDDLDSILKGLGESDGGVEAVPQMPKPSVSAEDFLNLDDSLMDFEDISMNPKMETSNVNATTATATVDSIMDGLDDLAGLDGIEEIKVDEPPMNTDLNMTEAGEPDLAGNGQEELMDLLAGSGIEDIGEILQDADGEKLATDADEIGNFADQQMQQLEEASEELPDQLGGEEAEDSSTGKKQKSKKKKEKKSNENGFFAKFKKILFGEDDPEDVEVNTISGISGENDIIGELSDENRAILEQLGEEDKQAQKGKNAKKAKKEKKPKKEKPKKEKPKKAPKPPKPKKEKKPKEKDNTPPLPKGPVIMVVVMVASFMILILLGTKLVNYSSSVNLAKSYYKTGAYDKGYNQLAGGKIEDKDMQLYNRLVTLAPISTEYESYEVFRKNHMDIDALDALTCALGRCEINAENAAVYECTDELQALQQKVANILMEEYGISQAEALEIYGQRNRTEYSIMLMRKAKSLGLEQ